MTSEAPRLSVVIPAFNEEERLVPSLRNVEGFLRGWGHAFEVLVLDDGSTDGTARVASEFGARHPGFRVIREDANRGKGAAVRRGFASSRGELVLFTDADLSTPIGDLDRLVATLESGADFVMGSRALPESNVEIRQAWFRDRMGKTFNLLVRLATGIPFPDTQCGFKLLRGSHARALAGEMREEGFAFDVELILLARRRGLVIEDVPVTWRNDAATRVHPVFDSWRMLRSLPRIVSRTGRYARRSGRAGNDAPLGDGRGGA